MTEIIRNIAPFPQPVPNKNPGGDCFACSLKAVIDGLFPERPIPFDAAWESFKVEAYGGGTVLSNTWPTMRRAIASIRDRGYDLQTRHDIALVAVDIETWSYTWGLSINEEEWSYRLEAWLSAGWLALAEVNFAGTGPITPNGYRSSADHFVCLDGQRHFWKPNLEFGGASLDHETHVVCSARGAYWINTADLLRKHGAAGLILVRKDETERRAAE